MGIEVKCKGCGEWIPLDKMLVFESGIYGTERTYECPICKTEFYKENPPLRDILDEALLLKKPWVRVVVDPFSTFPRWGTAEIKLEDLERVDVMCHGCKTWVPYRSLKREYTSSRYMGWVMTYHCPRCGTQVGGSHGPDPAYEIPSKYFDDIVMEAVRNGHGWARLRMEPEEETNR